MRYNVLDQSNTCSYVTLVEIVGGFQTITYAPFPSKKVINATSSVGASKESLLRASNESSLKMSIAKMCNAEVLPFNLGENFDLSGF